MKLIVGLGNPGKEYDMTRHNTGFYCLDVLSDEMNQSIDKEKFKGLYTKFKYKGEDVILLKPQTYMNNSGESVAAVMQFFKIPVEDLLVIYDDMDMPTGKLRLREKGSAGGHNGLKSVIERLGTEEFVRVRVGVGEQVEGKSLKDHVLERMGSEERRALAEAAARSADALECILVHGTASAMNRFN